MPNEPVARPEVQIEDDRTGMATEVVRRAYADHLLYSQAKDQHTATARDRFNALALAVRDRLIHRWIATQQAYYRHDAKRVYYLSAEFLVGRALHSNLLAVGLWDRARAALAPLGVELSDLLEQEEDPGLGNGGLGRLAACYLDSMATLALPGYGYGIRYEFGIFDQEIRQGYQVERPDEWLRFGNPWEVARPEYAYQVKLGGRTERVPDGKGGFKVRWVDTRDVVGIPYDTPVAGFGNDTVNTLRLWRARASREFDLQVFNAGDYVRAVDEKNASETISKVLYPNDESEQGRELRLKQQYFFVSCSIQDIVRRYRVAHSTWEAFPDKVAIQLNDTHPAIAIAELMRILVDEHGVPWDDAWRTTVASCGYTNHTIMPEALEKWPVALFERLLPRHLEIIYEINHRFLGDVLGRHPGDDRRLSRVSIIDDAHHAVRMAHLAIVGSHAVNGVAGLHSKILKDQLFRPFAELMPERFQNKTNGVTPRRWLLQANPRLAALITEAIGPGWVTRLDELRRLEPLAGDAAFRAKVRAIKRENKAALAGLVEKELGVSLDPDALFDIQVKRIHEYKRQLLNALHILSLYLKLKREPAAELTPRVFVFAGKAAPGYATAKLHIRLITAIGEVVNRDPEVRGRLKVVFVPNYSVSLAERIIPAADVSEQISTAGYEASGTGNMKLALNGALTVGTLDGANIEIREQVGEDNFFLFGLTAAEVAERQARGWRPLDAVVADPALGAVLEFLAGGALASEQPGVFQPILDNVLRADRYLVLADFADYAACQARVSAAYRDPEEWTRKAILNIARIGHMSADRAIREYAEEIWGAKSVPVILEPYVQK